MNDPLFRPGQYVASDLAHGYVVKWDPAEPDVIYAQTASGQPFQVSVATSCVIPGSFNPAPAVVTEPVAPPVADVAIAEKLEGVKRGR